MNKLLQKIKQLKNEQNKADITSFDFLKKDKAIKKPNNSRIKKFVTFILVSQWIFMLGNINNLNNYSQYINQESGHIYKDYKHFQEMSRSGNQQESVAAYANIVKSKEPINDLLAGGAVLLLLTKDDFKTDIQLTEEEKKLEEEYRIKLTPETTKTIVNLYKENWKSGINAQKEKFNNYTCLIVDLSCMAFKKRYEKTIMRNLTIIENKVNITHYNIEHLEEFVKWQRQTMETIKKNKNLPENSKLPILDNPGQIAFPYKY